MHGCWSGSTLLVNAEVDSMGGVVDIGVGIGIRTSPRRTAIEKAQAELRQEYDVREERKRELEFLEKGGNPLDFKLGNAASVSVQSTSLMDQHPEREAKGSFALTASPCGDSVESSGRPGTNTGCEPNSADNLLLFDGESEFLEGERNSVHRNGTNVVPSELSSQLDGSQSAKEVGDSAAFGIPKKAYRRRNRYRPNRDGACSSSTDIIPSSGGHLSSLPSHHGLKDTKGTISDINKNHNISSACNLKPGSPHVAILLNAGPSNSQLDLKLDGVQVEESAIELTKDGLPEAISDFNTSKIFQNNRHNQHSQIDAPENPICMASGVPESVAVGGREKLVSACLDCVPCAAAEIVEKQTSFDQSKGFSIVNDERSMPNEAQNSSAAIGTKGLDSESSCTQTSLSIDGNTDGDLCANINSIKTVSNVSSREGTLVFEEIANGEGSEIVKEKNETKAEDCCAFGIDDPGSFSRSHQDNGSILRDDEEKHEGESGLQNQAKHLTHMVEIVPGDHTASNIDKKPSNFLCDNSNLQKENACNGRLQSTTGSPMHELPETISYVMDSNVAADTGVHFKLANKADEDSILEEARIIEAKHKRIAELSIGILPLENHPKSHWDFVLEEMAWLANDFGQERLWKITAAAQICHQAAFTCQSRFAEQNLHLKQKQVAHTLAKIIMEFWRSAEEASKELELQHPGKNFVHGVRGYAVNYLKYSGSLDPYGHVETPVTLDRTSDLGIQEMRWEDHFTEENLFYTVPSGAIETYRKSIESHLMQCEKTGSSVQDEIETSVYDAVADNAYEEDEGEASSYFLPGAFEGSKSSKFAQKRRKKLTKSYTARSYELGADLPFMQCMETKLGTQQSVLVGKRSANSLDVGSIPTKKRVRTASRQRLLSPFGAGNSGCVQAPNKTDASSGDTNSFQDDQSTLHGGSHFPNGLEVESAGEFEKQLPLDSIDVSARPKKKKRAKHMVSTYEQRWQIDSSFQNEQRDYSRKRPENHQLESNGSSGLFGQQIIKKPKMMKQSLDSSFDNLNPMAGSIPSPVTSQMSNMSNPNKFIKMLGGRDRVRKAKALKMPAGQLGSGSQWSLFEDQALVVLVHDMGPNWELVSDAINSTLQFKYIFRKPKECKERHNILMDRTAGDGADSAEDSGSSQPYPSTLPGIPKGSARLLFQHLQGPMEEDTLKSHFEKIIMIGQRQLYRRTQNDNQDIKPVQPHSSHMLSLSQVCPNNLNGGPSLTPFDLCDSTASSPDVLSFGYQGPHASGLAISNQGSVASMLPSSSANSSLQGSSSVVIGSNYASESSPFNASVRDNRYGVPRAASLSIDEQQKMQQYNQILSVRNIQQSSLSLPGALPGTNRGARMLPGGNGMGILCGANRSMSRARPGFQGIVSSSMLNPGNMLSSSMVAIPSPVSMHTGGGPGKGNSTLRPRDSFHMMRPNQNPEHRGQMMVSELQMHATQGSGQGFPPFGGLSSAFPSQTASPPVQAYPLHHQQHQITPQQSQNNPHLQGPNRAPSSPHQAYAIRVPKESHLQQRLLQQQQQQQQLAASNTSSPHVQAQPQLPILTSPQNGSQTQLQMSSASATVSSVAPSSPMTPILQNQHKHQMLPHVLGRNPQTGGSGLTNQMGKQMQPQQQSSRHHPQHRQQLQSQQQVKISKGTGRGSMLMQQNHSVDASFLSGFASTPGNQSAEKGEQVMHLMQGQGIYSGSGLSSGQPSKPIVPSHNSSQSQPLQKIYSGQTITSSKQLQQVSSRSDNGNQGHVSPIAPAHGLSASLQAVPSLVRASSNHQQPEPHQNLLNQTQPVVQRVLQHSRQVNSDSMSKLQVDQVPADQQPQSNASQTCTTTVMSQACIDTVPVVTSASTPQWKAPGPLYDSGKPYSSSQSVSTGSPPLANSAGSELMPPVSQGLGRRHSLGSLPHGQPPSTLASQQQLQQEQSPQRQLPLQPQSQQQMQHLQAGNNSVNVRSTNSRLK